MEIICGWHVANSILLKSFEEKRFITSLKLNYMVYLLCSEYLYLNGEMLFSELFEKTKIGPVVPSVYSKFDLFSRKLVTNFAKDSIGRVMGVNSVRFDECLSWVWDKYKNVDDDTILLFIKNGYCYSRKELGEILTEADMLMDEISRKEKELEIAKIYLDKITSSNMSKPSKLSKKIIKLK